jgi:hypothetical protein
MKTHFRTAAIAASSATALGYATVTFSNNPHPPPPPPYNPQITYAVGGGNSTTFDVSNADGTDVVSLYSTRNITSGLKFAPTGNRIVFTEQNAIKVLTYAVSSQGVTATSVTTLTNEPYQPLHVDVSPDGTQLLFIEKTATPSQYAIYVMSMSGGLKTLVSTDLYLDAVWAHSNSRIAVIQGAQIDGGLQTIRVFDLDVNNNYNIINSTTVFTSRVSRLYQISRIESAHTSDTLVFGASPSGSNFSVYTVDIGTMAVSAAIVAGANASFSADDSTILFVGPTAPYLYEFNLNTNTQMLISSKGITRPDFLP